MLLFCFFLRQEEIRKLGRGGGVALRGKKMGERLNRKELETKSFKYLLLLTPLLSTAISIPEEHYTDIPSQASSHSNHDSFPLELRLHTWALQGGDVAGREIPPAVSHLPVERAGLKMQGP